ncbi:MAG: type II toxin-antitoxin system ParD family antitoxin [Rhizomicrobium sp.]|jgi:antitoxin ParD1/3/4
MDTLKSFVEGQAARRGGSESDYIRELIHADQDRQRLRGLLLDGAASPSGASLDETYFSDLHAMVDAKAR